MNDFKVAILGAGHGGHGMMAHFLSLGLKNLSWWNRRQSVCQAILQKGSLVSSGAINGTFDIPFTSSNIELIIKGASLVMLAVPASAHEEIAQYIAPFINRNGVILLNPGRTGGAIVVYQILRKQGREDVFVGETQTFSYTCRCIEPGLTEVLAIKKYNEIGFIGNKIPSKIQQFLENIYPCMKWHKGTLQTSLMNIGAMLHPAPVLLNTGRIESPNCTFHHYYEGITPSVAKFLEKLDMERLAIGKFFNVELLSISDWHKECYGKRGNNLYDSIQINKSYTAIKAPVSLDHRYLWEDVPTGIVPLLALSHAIGTSHESLQIVLDLTRMLTGKDYWAIGRNDEYLGLKDGLGKEEIMRLFEVGNLS